MVWALSPLTRGFLRGFFCEAALAETAPEPARTLAAELLHTRHQVVTIRGLLGVYSPRTVERAYEITREILGE